MGDVMESGVNNAASLGQKDPWPGERCHSLLPECWGVHGAAGGDGTAEGTRKWLGQLTTQTA